MSAQGGEALHVGQRVETSRGPGSVANFEVIDVRLDKIAYLADDPQDGGRVGVALDNPPSWAPGGRLYFGRHEIQAVRP